MAGPDEHVTGIIIVDHGSRREASNTMLKAAAEAFAACSQYDIVEPAHMELAAPDIAAAFQTCVERGATRVVVFPYFLSPGRHWTEDIPRLTRTAAADFPNVEWLVTAPFGRHPGMTDIIADRIEYCLERAKSDGPACDVCESANRCELQQPRDRTHS